MAVAFIFIFLVLHPDWQTVGAQEMLNCSSDYRTGRNLQEENGVAASQKSCVDKPPGKVWPLSFIVIWPTSYLVGIQIIGNSDILLPFL